MKEGIISLKVQALRGVKQYLEGNGRLEEEISPQDVLREEKQDLETNMSSRGNYYFEDKGVLRKESGLQAQA